MNKVKSSYLEILRIVSALYVFIWHFASETIKGDNYFCTCTFAKYWHLKKDSAHYFVVIFFLLSGYLITLSSLKKGVTYKSFIIDRLGRLYSVLIPALVFCFLIAIIINNGSFGMRDYIIHYNNLLYRFCINILFLSQSFNLSGSPPLNQAVWSVQYEFIFYIFWGALIFLKKTRRIVVILFLILISFPKILFLFPLWLMGAMVFYFEKKKFHFIPSLLTFVVSTLIIFLFLIKPDLVPFNEFVNSDYFFGINLYFSANFRADYIFGLIMMINFLSFFAISEAMNCKIGQFLFFILFYTIVRKIGNCTYTLYLFHTPLLFLYATILPFNRFNNFHIFFLIILVVLSVYFIARHTEWKVLYWREKVSKAFKILYIK